MRLTDALPQVFVTDMDRAVGFYTAALGFTVEYLYGAPPYYGEVRRDGVRLNLRHVDRPPMDPAVVQRDELLAASVLVEDIDALDAAFRSREVPMEQTLARQPWGARRLIVRDPDGNLLMFMGE